MKIKISPGRQKLLAQRSRDALTAFYALRSLVRHPRSKKALAEARSAVIAIERRMPDNCGDLGTGTGMMVSRCPYCMSMWSSNGESYDRGDSLDSQSFSGEWHYPFCVTISEFVENGNEM